MRRVCSQTVLHVLLLWTAFVVQAAEVNLENADFSGKLLVDLLSLYQMEGVPITYSRTLVSRTLRVTKNPVRGNAFMRLRAILEEFDLLLRDNPDAGGWFIVRSAQSPPELRLQIVDKQLNLPVAGAKVVVGSAGAQDTTYTTDASGRVELSAGYADHLLEVAIEHPGYLPLITEIRSDRANSIGLMRLELLAKPDIEEMLVTTSKYRIAQDPTASTRAFETQVLNARPLLGGDPLRILSTIPGIASLGLSADANIRGGAREELLVRFNDVELIEPYHLKDFENIFSTLNPAVISVINVYTGGFPARYGNRMSGVLDIETNNSYQGYGLEFDLSLLNASLLGFGALSESMRWNASARRGNLDLIIDAVSSEIGSPRYADFHVQVVKQIDQDKTLDFGILGSNDNIELQNLDNDERATAFSNYDSLYGWLHHRTQAPGRSSRYSAVLTRIDNDRGGTANGNGLDFSRGFVRDERKFTLLRLEQLVVAESGTSTVTEYGWNINYSQGSYNYQVQAEIGEFAGLLGRPVSVDTELIASPSGFSGSAHATRRWRLFPDFALQLGLRLDAQDYYKGSTDVQISPRVSIGYSLGESHQFKFSAGRFHQPEAIYELQVENGLQRFQHKQFTDQATLGYEYFHPTGLRFRAEAYYKRVRSPHQRSENLLNPLVLLAEIAPDRVDIVPSKARAMGLELSLSYQPSARFQSWLNIGVSKAQDRINDRWASRRWDERTSAGVGAVWTMSRWTASLVAAWHPGWRTTQLPEFTSDLSVGLDLAANDKRLPFYFSLDAKLAYVWDWPRHSIKLYAEVTNISNRKNVGGVEFELESQANGFDIEAEETRLLPTIPTIGFVWYFN